MGGRKPLRTTPEPSTDITPAPVPAVRVDLVWVEFDALTQAPFFEAASLLTELAGDGVETGVMAAELPRTFVREALHELGLLEMLDFVWHREGLMNASADELRRLAAPATLAIRSVDMVRYEKVRRLLNRRTRKAALWELRAPLDWSGADAPSSGESRGSS